MSDLATRETRSSELALYQQEQWESDGTEDIAPSFPIVKGVQATSSMEGAGRHGGEFWRSDTEEYLPSLDIVALFQKDTRAYFVEGNDQPACMSTNGLTPLPNQPLWTARGEESPVMCDMCPLSAWGDDGSPPACKESKIVLADLDGELIQLRIGGTWIKPWTRFISKRLRPKKLPLCSQRLHLTTDEKSEPGKKWYELRIDATPLPYEDARQYNAVIQYERSRFERAVQEPHEADSDAPARQQVDWPSYLPSDLHVPAGDNDDAIVLWWNAIGEKMAENGLAPSDMAKALKPVAWNCANAIAYCRQHDLTGEGLIDFVRASKAVPA
jgi:hypothetical protein